MQPVLRLEIALEPQSVSQARAFVRQCLADWQVTDPEDVAPLVVSELVTNAVRHGGGHVTLFVARRSDRIVLSVVDGSTQPVAHGEAGPLEESGRGLHLVEVLSLAWGTQLLPVGKRVWAEISSADGDVREVV